MACKSDYPTDYVESFPIASGKRLGCGCYRRPARVVTYDELEWHLHLTVWSTVRGEARWDLSPSRVLSRPELYPRHWQQIIDADLSFPLEMFRQGERWVLLDGYHRLARCRLEGRPTVCVRLHPDECWSAIVCET